MRPALIAAVLFAFCAAACSRGQEAPAPIAAAGAVNVYTSRHYDADGAVYARFTQETGIEVRTLEAPGDQLLERLKGEGAQSPADVIITVDAGNLWRLTEAGLLQSVQSSALEAATPAAFRDPQGRWFAFSKRARVIVYAPDRVSADKVATYDQLADPALKGRLCMRSSTNVYNLSLLAARIEALGLEAAEAWAQAVVANFARDPQGSDTDQIKAVAAGECDATLVNHYYLVRMQGSPDPIEQKAAAAVAMSLPDQAGRGAHVNVSGAGVAAHAPNPENAVKLLEFLATPAAQAEFAALNDELPIRADVPLPPNLMALQGLKEDAAVLQAVGPRQAEAQAVFDRAGWR